MEIHTHNWYMPLKSELLDYIKTVVKHLDKQPLVFKVCTHCGVIRCEPQPPRKPFYVIHAKIKIEPHCQ